MKNIDWKILTVLYEKKSITQAADVLFMTQPALTKRIKGIEAEWNIEIVNRSNRGISLTEDGKYLCKKAITMQELLKEIEDHFSKEQASLEVFRLGVPNSYARLHLSKLLRFCKPAANGIQLQTVHNSSDILLRQLIDGNLDAAIICGNYTYLGEQMELMDENLYMVTQRGVDLKDAGRLPFIESFLNPRVKSIVNQWWKNEYGNLPIPAHSVPYSDIAIEMVQNGLGVTFLFGDTWDIDYETCQLIPIHSSDGEAIHRKVHLMMSEKCFQSQAVMDLISGIESYYKINQLDRLESYIIE